MGKLIHRMEGKYVGEYPLKAGTLSIGRKQDNDIRLDDRTVSSHHALLRVEPSPHLYQQANDVFIEDRGSTNGVIIRGKKVTKELLKHGDVVRIGNHEFEYVDEEKLRLEKTMILNSKDPS